jgi:hypothetical protein
VGRLRHSGAYRLPGVEPSSDPRTGESLDAIERWSGLLVPAAVREWYGAPGLAERLGEAAGGIDHLARAAGDADGRPGLLPPGRPTAAAAVAVPAGTVVRPAGALIAGADDPPVRLIDPDDFEPPRRPYAESFSEYVGTAIRDARHASRRLLVGGQRAMRHDLSI